MAQLLRRQRRAADQRCHARPKDAVRPHHPQGQVGDMHRAALARAAARGLAIDFRHHRLHVDALGDAMPVPAMGRGDAVAVVQMRHDADRRGLLSGVKMDEAGDLAAREIDMQPLLEIADGAHPAIGVQKLLFGQRKWI
jgi:hypothetical protein